jgi:hypothetical protein
MMIMMMIMVMMGHFTHTHKMFTQSEFLKLYRVLL